MSIWGNAITLGSSGGGGGPSASDAILTVTVPTGSTVTAVKGGVTLTPTMWVQAADNTLDCALFVIAPSLFDSQNAWTVTISDSGTTTNLTIIINTNKQYALSVVKKWIVRDGIIIDIGSSAFQNVTVTETSSGYVLVKNTGNSIGGFKSSSIVFSPFSKIVLELALDGSNIYGQSWKGSGIPALGYGSNFYMSGDAVAGFEGLTYLKNSTGTITESIFELDISNISSAYSVICTCSGSANISGTLGYLNIKNFYLE